MGAINKLMGLAASGMLAQQTNMDVISNNIANMHTTGFKKSRLDFADVVNLSTGNGGGFVNPEAPNGEMLLPVAGVNVAGTQRLLDAGSLLSTNRSLDLAIVGNGYFQVQLPDGRVGYTRDGSLHLDADGRLVNSSGLPLLPDIQTEAPEDQLRITEEGQVLQLDGDQPIELGQLSLARFPNETGLQAIGYNIYVETPASGAPMQGNPGNDGLGQLSQYTMESSNVDIAQEMVNLIVAQRAYQISSRAVQVADEMLSTANRIRG